MKIDYEKFNEYSEKSQLRIAAFVQFLLSAIEIYGENKIPISEFEKDSFSLEESISLVKKINEIIDNTITEFYSDTVWDGHMNNRTSKTYVYLKNKTNTIQAIESFLSGISKNKKINQSFKKSDIKKIEILESAGRIKVYINKNYSNELDFSRKKYWGKMYDLAENQYTNENVNFLGYFNFNKKNPLYAKYGFNLTKILKIEDHIIVPIIEISLIKQKKVTQIINSA